ncbi:hypothetical protein CRG98_009481 [Punica granatum]|uniref:Uncharacterized protein n=1 Tax=Punica granatum TaxID=22663 RepID=A0A2I0KNY4_PUNGR|nr:hypothetical protein CRG98_009481 [Punica granatum]
MRPSAPIRSNSSQSPRGQPLALGNPTSGGRPHETDKLGAPLGPNAPLKKRPHLLLDSESSRANGPNKPDPCYMTGSDGPQAQENVRSPSRLARLAHSHIGPIKESPSKFGGGVPPITPSIRPLTSTATAIATWDRLHQAREQRSNWAVVNTLYQMSVGIAVDRIPRIPNFYFKVYLFIYDINYKKKNPRGNHDYDVE